MLRVSSALCELFGRSRQDLLATTFQALTHPDDRGDDEPVMEILLRGEQKHRSREAIHPRRRPIWAEVGVSVIVDANGASASTTVQVQDITQRRAHGATRHMADHDPLTGLLNRRGFDRGVGRPHRGRSATA